MAPSSSSSIRQCCLLPRPIPRPAPRSPPLRYLSPSSAVPCPHPRTAVCAARRPSSRPSCTPSNRKGRGGSSRRSAWRDRTSPWPCCSPSLASSCSRLRMPRKTCLILWSRCQPSSSSFWRRPPWAYPLYWRRRCRMPSLPRRRSRRSSPTRRIAPTAQTSLEPLRGRLTLPPGPAAAPSPSRSARCPPRPLWAAVRRPSPQRIGPWPAAAGAAPPTRSSWPSSSRPSPSS
mmetsp:Transcript_9528/g.23273  ORF Transcript_9528/g.23273 Transcript_9528/m.23273 type:complete len:231 (+) Transcript_9528:831-1523(+)